MATAGNYSNFGLLKEKDGVNNNEEEPQDTFQGTDPNLGHQKKKEGLNNNTKGEKIGDENLEETSELAVHLLADGSEFEDSEGSENSDDNETVSDSGSSENSSDSEEMVENNNEELLDVAEGLIKDLCDISYKNKHRHVINSVLDIELEETPLPKTVMDKVEELLRHPDVDVQSKMIEVKYFPMGWYIEAAETMADVWEDYDSEEIDEFVDMMPELSDDDNGSSDQAIMFQGTLLHLAVSSGNFELFKVLAPYFEDLNPEVETKTRELVGGSCARGPTTPSWVFAETPRTPAGYMKLTPLIIAAAEGQKDVYDFLIAKIGEENLEKIPELAYSL